MHPKNFHMCYLANNLPAPLELRGGIPVAVTLGTIKVPWCSGPPQFHLHDVLLDFLASDLLGMIYPLSRWRPSMRLWTPVVRVMRTVTRLSPHWASSQQSSLWWKPPSMKCRSVLWPIWNAVSGLFMWVEISWGPQRGMYSVLVFLHDFKFVGLDTWVQYCGDKIPTIFIKIAVSISSCV